MRSVRPRNQRILGVVLTVCAAGSLIVGCGKDPETPGTNSNNEGQDASVGAAKGSGGKSGGGTGGHAGKGSGGVAVEAGAPDSSTSDTGGKASAGGSVGSGGKGGTGGSNGSGGNGGTVGTGGSTSTGGTTGGPVCGDHHVDTGEECDDGNLKDGDGCSSQCTNKCEQCWATGLYPGGTCQALADGCFKAVGNATSGPGTGVSKAELCGDVIACVHRTKCAAPPLTAPNECYCGAGVSFDDCFSTHAVAPHGPCKDEIEAAAETTEIDPLSQRFFVRSGPGTALGYGMTLIQRCEMGQPFSTNCVRACNPGVDVPDGG